MNSHAPEPVPQVVLDDLRGRLRATRWVALPQGVGWDRGTDAAYLAELVTDWGGRYDWREHEQRILALPWVHTGAGAHALRSIHQRTADPSAPTAVLLHGWPDSVLRFERALPRLTDVNVVVPALPGYPFARELRETGMSVTKMAQILAEALAELGYDRYVLSAGDVGANVAEQLAATHPDRVAALHLTNLSPRHLTDLDASTMSPAEQAAVAEFQQWRMTEGGYIAEQSTKPHSLAPALGDSPAGLAAWIIEKLRSWSDCGGDIESVFSRDELLTWITAYWVTGTIGTSFSAYVERPTPVTRVATPTVMSVYPRDILPLPRSVAERFLNVQIWNEHEAGGHFGAWEQPVSYVDDLRSALQRGVAARS